MTHMGFSNKWIKATSAMYSNATSKVIAAGGKGESFRLSRSVRQGCPMAPYLFLLFANAMSIYLSTPTVGVQGITLPNSSEEMLDSEFADDTILYVKGALTNLCRLKKLFG